MKPVAFRLLILCVPLLLSACAAQGAPGGAYSGTLVLEGRHVYGPETVLPGVLIVVDGEVELEAGARVAGPAFLLGGVLDIGGEVEGDVSAIGGRLVVDPGARIRGDLRVGSRDPDVSPQAVIEGQVLAGAASGVEPEDLFPERSLQTELIWLLPEALALGGLAYLAVRFAPRATARVSRAAAGHPVVSAAMGLLASLVGLVFLVVIAFTLILIPVTLLGLLAGFLAIGFGWIGIGVAAGRRMDGKLRRSLSPGASAFWGTFLFMLLLNLLALLPYVGDWVDMLAAVLSLGAVLLTRFGLREFVPDFDH
jgi:hypothetical protein